MNPAPDKPWDARLAERLLRPWRDSGLTPNHLTTLRLLCGLAACAFLSLGGFWPANAGAACFCLSNFLDHADGELARMTGMTSRFGHLYDLLSDAAVNVLLFVGMGIGLMNSELGVAALPLGCLAGLSVAGIFHMRHAIEQQVGRDRARQPHRGGVEAEDVLYLLPAITLAGQLLPFLILAAIGAPLFAGWVLRDYIAMQRRLN